MVKRDPHVVLGVQAGASSATIKAAWRRLARENHPDLTGDDPAASRVATRRMAEINDAYAALVRSGDATSDGGRRPDGTPFEGETPGPTRWAAGPEADAAGDRAAGHELHVPGEERGQLGSVERRTRCPGSHRCGQTSPDARRRGRPIPNGPLVRDRVRGFKRPTPPTLAVASAHVLEFGKFHGHTLGEVAAFEPSYVDWLVGTVMRDPDMAASARVVQADLDRRGVLRRRHPSASDGAA